MNYPEIENEELVEQMAYLAFAIILNCLQLLQICEYFLSKAIYFINPTNTDHKTILLIIRVFLHQNYHFDLIFITHNLYFTSHKL